MGIMVQVAYTYSRPRTTMKSLSTTLRACKSRGSRLQNAAHTVHMVFESERIMFIDVFAFNTTL
jgi:hypothetical protein